MKNMIIAALMTYIFWTDICVIHPLPVLPMIFGVIWMLLAAMEDLVKDFRKAVARGNKLNYRIDEIKRKEVRY